MTIEPDTKDWTWVLDEPCAECGFVASDVLASDVARRVRATVPLFRESLASPTAAERPSPTSWSPLEYACHVRDVHRLYTFRLGLMLEHEDPEFPNWDQCSGHNHAYPPEQAIDLEATYPGWYKAVRWQRWFSRAQDKHVIDLQAAFSPVFEYYPKCDRAVGYAYAEFSAERRQEIKIQLGLQDATKVWFNGTLIFETEHQVPHDQFEEESVDNA